MNTTAARPAFLTDADLARGVSALADRDADLAAVVERFGPPPMWARPPGFATLANIVLEQQVSLSSAQAAFDRLVAAAGSLTPRRFLEFSDAELLAIGFSRQKARYVRLIAAAIDAESLDLDALAHLDDEAAHGALVALTGVGPWSANVYLLMVLRRPDVWPAADIALATAVREVKGFAHRPNVGEMDALAEAWRPWRAVAARLFWHHYLSVRGRRG